MEDWKKILLLLCAFGVLTELRPSETYVTEYLLTYKNLTAESIIHVAFPVSTYSSLLSLILVFLITDFVRYKPVIIFEAVSYIIVWGLLIFGQDLISVIIVEIFYGLGGSAHVAYSTYIYSKVDNSHYKIVTSYNKTATLLGKFLGGLVAQICVSFHLLNLHELNYFSLLCSCFAFLAAIALPHAKKSYYFHRSVLKPEDIAPEELKLDGIIISSENQQSKCQQAFKHLWHDFKCAFSQPYVFKWSLWWALASAGQYQVLNYIQALWEVIATDEVRYNGVVKSIHTLSSAILACGVGYLTISWEKWGEGFLTIVSFLQGLLLLWMANTNSLMVAYLAYIMFRVLHPCMLTVASAEIAQKINKDSYALVFGINTFIALAFQTLLTLVVTDQTGLALNERNQYAVYGYCYFGIGLVFMVFALLTVFVKFNMKNSDFLQMEEVIPKQKSALMESN